MLERTPAEDNLYDETGRVKDIDAAQEMAELEQYYHDADAARLFRPSKRESAQREADLDAAGRQIVAEKKREREAHLKWERQEQADLLRHKEFIRRNLREDNLSQDKWSALSPDEQARLETEWKRREEVSPEWKLEQRLKALIGQKVISFEVGNFGDVTVRFDDGFALSFQSWNARDDEADYDAVEVKQENG